MNQMCLAKTALQLLGEYANLLSDSESSLT